MEYIANKQSAIFTILIIGASLISLLISRSGIAGGMLFLVFTIAVPVVYGIIAYPKFGIVILLIGAYSIMFLIRLNLVNFPLGTVMDIIQLLLIIGFFVKQKYDPDWSMFRDPLGIIILIWIIYNIAQVANPTAESRLAWVYTIRSVAGVMLMYFVFVYQIRDIKFIRFIFKMWIGLTFIAALYAYKQEYIGFFHFEEVEIFAPRQRALLFINGVWRKFSIFSDPVAFSYNMVSCSLFCITMLFGPLSIQKKVFLGILCVFFLNAMLFSGTRGAYVLVPIGIALLTILKFNKRIFLFSITGGILLFLLINIPSGSPTIRRFQSAFKPSNDASFNVRAINQKRIQPFIQTHPFGGGLGATGVWGSRFSPNSFLATFPPDSGYVRVAVELGWVGLLLFCTLMFIILRIGIMNYYLIKNPELKTYCLAMIIIVFAYAVGNYPQEALVQFPSNIYIYLFAAIITLTVRLDSLDNPSIKKVTGKVP